MRARHHRKGARGERAPQSKLTTGDVLEIRRLRRDGLGLRVLAARFGVSVTQAWRVAHGVDWKHVWQGGTDAAHG